MSALPSIQPSAIPVVGASAGAAAPPIAATSATAATPSASNSTFAGALQDAGAKPARKAASSKNTDSARSGATLPVNGNAPPPTPLIVPAVIPVTTASGAYASAPLAAGLSAAATIGTSTADESPDAADATGDAAERSPRAVDGIAAPSGSIAAFATVFGDSAATDQQAGAAPAAAGGSKGATPESTSALPVDVTAAGAPAAGAPAGGTLPAGTLAALIGGSKGAPATGHSVSPAGAKAQAVFRGAAFARNAEVDSDAGDSEPAAPDAATPNGVGLTQAIGAASTASSAVDPGTLATAATVQLRPVGATATDTTDTAGITDDTGALPTGAPGSAAGVAGTGAGPPAALAAARTATAMSAANAFATQAVSANDKHSHSSADTSVAASGLDSGAGAAAGLSQAGSTAVSATDAATPTFRIAANVDGSDFSQGLGDRVSWMVSNDLNGAKLQVNPSQLGPIELRISVSGDHAQVWMSTHSAVTRDALESSASKLREMLGAQGFGQVSVDISQRSFQDRSAYAQPYEAPVSKAAADLSTTSIGASATTRALTGMLDAYA